MKQSSCQGCANSSAFSVFCGLVK